MSHFSWDLALYAHARPGGIYSLTHMASPRTVVTRAGPLQLSDSVHRGVACGCARGLEPLTVGARTSIVVFHLSIWTLTRRVVGCGTMMHGARTYICLWCISPTTSSPRGASAECFSHLHAAERMPSACRARCEAQAREEALPNAEEDRFSRGIACGDASVAHGQEASVCWLPRRGAAPRELHRRRCVPLLTDGLDHEG